MGKAVQSKNSLILKVSFSLTDSIIFFLPVLTWSVVAVSHGFSLPKTNPVNQPQQMCVQKTSGLTMPQQPAPKGLLLLTRSSLHQLCLEPLSCWGGLGSAQGPPTAPMWNNTSHHQRLWVLPGISCAAHTLWVCENKFLPKIQPFQTSSIHSSSLQKVPSVISWVSWIKKLLLWLLVEKGDGSWNGHLKLQPNTFSGVK